MNNLFTKAAFFAVILLLVSVIAGQNLSAYAYVSNPPSFGGGKVVHYTDGLEINGNTFDISQFSQKISKPQILTVGKSSTITLKIFDNAGPASVKWAALYMNIWGPNLVVSGSDTFIQYNLNKNLVILNDHQKLLGTVTAESKISGQYVYVTFHITPISKMATSNLIVTAVDDRRATTNSLIIDAIKFS